jgi:hypothetical protein
MLPVRIVLLLAVVSFLATAPGARADRLDDALDTVWEATWDGAGIPRAQQQLATLEQRMDGPSLEKARSLGPHGAAPAPAPAATPPTSPAPATD